MSGPRILSLFSGYGGLDLAVQAVLGGEIIAHAEIEPAACRILEHRFPDVPNLGDVSLVDWSSLGRVDVVVGGFPCQDVSSAGKRLGLRPDTRSGLWTQMSYAIDQLRPGLVVIENVRGLLSAAAHSDLEPCPWCVGDGGGVPLRALGAVLGDLADLRYDASWQGFRASDVGAPHGRFRVFITARPAADAHRLESERARDGRDLGSAPAEEPREGLQRERAGHAAGDRAATPGDAPSDPRRIRDGDGREAAADAGGEALGLRTGLRADEPRRIRGGRPDDGRASSAPADALGLGRDRGTPVPVGRQEGRAAAAGSGGGDRPRGPVADTDDGQEPRRPERVDPPALVGTGAGASAGDRPGGAAEGAGGLVGAAGPEWGPYAAAVRGWERLTRPAPAPTEAGARGGQRLSPAFVEWMMGLPPGWVTEVPGLTRNEQLKALGNGVVPQQAAHALRLLLTDFTVTEVAS